jgi:hypothetical protein
MMQEMANNPDAQAMERWTNAMIAFAMNNPEQAKQINDMFQEYSPNPQR